MLFELRGRARSAALALAILAAGCAQMSGDAPLAGDNEALTALAKESLAKLDGELTVAGLQQPVEVIRDEWGIPHIYAQNTEDLFFAQGYVAAQDRLWQMDLWRRWLEGRLSEIYGPEALPYDERIRLMMFRGPWDEKEWTSYHPQGEAIFTSFANGVNAFIAENQDNLPIEFKLTGITPEPWTAKTVVLRWASIGLSSVRGHGINELQLAFDVARYGREEANRRTAVEPYDDLAVPEGLDVSLITEELIDAARLGDGDPLVPGELPDLEVVPAYRDQIAALPRTALTSYWDPMDAGSNNWVVSPSRTTTGKVILSNDPHRRIEMPALRWFSHLVAPGWNLQGAGEPPFAGIDAGHNETMAWGFTFAGTDMVDVYVEQLNPENPGEVRWQDGWEPLRTITEEIRVKGEATPRTVALKFSRHGPVFHVDEARNVAYAVRSVSQEPGTAPYKGSFQLAQMPSCNQFFEKGMAWKVPTHNLICGDTEGNIAFQLSGLTPDRTGYSGRLPVPGWSGEYEWRGFREDLPRELNPERGYIATANDNTHPKGYQARPVMYHSSRGVEYARITRIHQMLGTGTKLSLEDLQTIQTDAYSLRAAADLPAFQGWTSQDANVEKARALVAEWDAVVDRSSVPGAIYVTWTDEVEGVAQDVKAAIEERRAAAEAGLVKSLAKLTAELGPDMAQWRYGRIHTTELPHRIAPAFDLPTAERSGGFNTVNADGANFRRILDLSNWDNSVGGNAPGQSGQPGSPFYDNLREPWINGQFIPLVYSREAVEAKAAHRLTLRPGARTASR